MRTGRLRRLAWGDPRTRFWFAIGGTAILAAAAIAPFASWPSEHPVALGSLTPGSCFRLPSKNYRQTHSDAFDGFPREVVRAECEKTHLGEVVAQATIAPDRIPFDDLPGASRRACMEPFAEYNPDFWALPPNADMTFVPPRERDLKDHPVTTCIYLGAYVPLTGALRADTSHLTAEQRHYLDAVRPYNEASANGLENRDSIRTDELIAWAQEMAAAEQRTVDELQQIGAPTGVEQQFTVVLDQHRKAISAWQAAATETAPKEIHRRMTTARDAEHASMDADQAVRAALGLTTTMRPRGYSL